MMEMPVLETERLCLRPFQPDDLESIYRTLDVELAGADFGGEGHLPMAARREWLKWSILNYSQLAFLRQPPYGDRAVVLKSSGNTRLSDGGVDQLERMIGVVGLVPAFGPFGQLPSFGGRRSRNTPEMGMFYAISPQGQRRGFASEAAKALIDYAFSSLDLARIVATTSHGNAPSQAVMRKLGMRVEHNPYPDPPWFQVVGILENP